MRSYSDAMPLEALEHAIDAGASLVFVGSTDSRLDTIQAMPHGYGWFYNGDVQAQSFLFRRLIEDNRVNLAAWMLCMPSRAQQSGSIQLSLFAETGV